MAEKVLDNSVTRQVRRTAANIITRSLLGALGLGGRTAQDRKPRVGFDATPPRPRLGILLF